MHVAQGGLSIEAVAQPFWARMDGVMLGTGGGLQIAWIVALETAHEGRAHLARQVGIFAPGFLPSPPARIPKKIDIRAPQG